MASAILQVVPQFKSGENPAESWKSWLERFRIYLVATEVNKKSEEVQIAQLLHYGGPEIYKIYSTFELTAEEKTQLEVIIQKFNQHFIPRENLTFLRYKFFMSRQDNRSTEQFVTDLKNKPVVASSGL